jgi:exosortase family protein XrtF
MSANFNIKEFIPTILFLAKFVGIYLVGSFLYGVYVTAYEPTPDPATRWVTRQTALVLTSCGWPAKTEDSTKKPITNISFKGKNILAVYEGCNGINVMIIFVAFLFAFGPVNNSLFWFIPLGLIIIHLVNLARITLLFWVSIYKTDYMYFMHKYFFTAIIYVVVFAMWVYWVRKFSVYKPVAA